MPASAARGARRSRYVSTHTENPCHFECLRERAIKILLRFDTKSRKANGKTSKVQRHTGLGASAEFKGRRELDKEEDMETPRWLRRALQMPAFVFGVLALHWAPVLAVLTGRINLLQRKKRNDAYHLTKVVMDVLRVRVVRVGREELYRGGRCMYLCNHRSWADFFIDENLTEGRTSPLSRGMVAVGFPVLVLPLMAARAILVFNKAGKKVKEIEAFNKWLDEQTGSTPHSSILVYPEGHRGTGAQSQPLKRGMLHYAYSRNLPIQLVLSANKEAVLSERQETARFGQTVVTSYSELLEPSKYHDFEEFVAEVTRDWDKEWRRVHSARLEGLSEMRQPSGDHLFEYSPSQHAWTAVVDLLCTAALLSTLYITYTLAAWVGALLGPLAPLAAGLLVVYIAASCWECSRPVDLRGAPGARGGPSRVDQKARVPQDSASEEPGAAVPVGGRGDFGAEKEGARVM